MSVLAVHLYFIVLCLAYAQDDTPAPISPECMAGFKDLKSNQKVNMESCKGRCLVKCCPEKQIFLANGSATACVDSDTLTRTYGVIGPDDYTKSPIDIYNNDFKNKAVITNKKLSDFTFVFSQRFREPDCTHHFSYLFPEKDNKHKYYLSEDAKVSVWTANELNPWNDFSTDQFCVEHLVALQSGVLESVIPRVDLVAFTEVVENIASNRAQLGMYGMIISCFFLALTMFVYIQLRLYYKLPGKMATAFVGTFLAAFLCRAVQVIGKNFEALDHIACSVMGILLIYMLLSTFTWMIAFSYDFWCVVKNTRMTRHMSSREITVKFRQYALFAWGLPLLPVLFIIIVEHLDLTHLPKFVKPRIIYELKDCFLGEDERRLYLNIPILIAVLTNTVLFVLSAFKIFNITAGVQKNMPAGVNRTGSQDRNRFYLILKVSALMGITWIFEVISTEMDQDSPVWYAFDAYNALSGVIVFIIYVCKIDIALALCKRFRHLNELAVKCGIRAYLDERNSHGHGTSTTDTEFSDIRTSSKSTEA